MLRQWDSPKSMTGLCQPSNVLEYGGVPVSTDEKGGFDVFFQVMYDGLNVKNRWFLR